MITTGGRAFPRTWLGRSALALVSILAACGGGDEPQANKGPRARALAIAPPSASQWSAPIGLTLVPSSAAHLPDGKLLLWSSDSRLDFSAPGQTYTATFDPSALTATEALVTQTGHNMFCTGTSNLPDGSLLVNGGVDSSKTSLYNPLASGWSVGATMNISRGYSADTVTEDGSVFTFGGSWSGGEGGKHGEVWTPGGGWRTLSGVPVTPALAPDPNGVYRGDNHMWLFAAPNGQVLHAGPSASMHWISTSGSGAITTAGSRGDDAYSMAGNAVMYDIGKILKAGGAPAYENLPASTASYVIDINGDVSVRKVAPMTYPRIFANGVVLPNGQVVIIGGQTIGKPFSDDNSILVPEIWDPTTETFSALPPISAGRNYHSVALLLPDGRVMSAGGGLCGTGCAANHPDIQILTPNYLYKPDGTPATRPALSAAPATAVLGTTIAVTADGTATSFALVRMSSTTHTVNNDQRRVPLQATSTGGGGFNLQLPSNPGILLPGYYMLFAMNADGTPSIAKILRVDASAAPKITNPGNQSTAIGSTVQLQLAATTASGTLTYSASGLPAGLAINPATGVISGTPTSAGVYTVAVAASNGTGTVSTNVRWAVYAPVAGARYARLEALSEINGKQITSMAEFNLLDAGGAVIPRTGWTVSADSQELAAENGAVANVLDGDPATIWHTQWSPAEVPLPHTLTVDTGTLQTILGFRYLPRQDGWPNGNIGQWRFSVSADGVNWTVLGTGNFGSGGAYTSERTAFFPTVANTNKPPTLAAVSAQSNVTGTPLSLTLSASDPDGDTLSFAASNLPPGLTINASTGTISGTPTVAGTYGVTVTVSDGKGGSVTGSFSWVIGSSGWVIDPVVAPPSAAGTSVTYTVASGGGAGTTYSWNFGDGSPATAASTSTSASHVFTAAGLYVVTVTATDGSGTVKTLSFTQAVYGSAPSSQRPSQSSNVMVEPRASAPARVWLVNQDNDSVSVFDTATNARVAEIAVGSMPRTLALAPNGRVWVVNKGGASITIIDPSTLAVVQTVAMPRASMPFGIVFAPDGSAAYVTLEATAQVQKLSPTTGAVLATLAVGTRPRHLSVTASSGRQLAPDLITPPLPGEGTSVVRTEIGGVQYGGQVSVVALSTMSVERTIVLRHSDKVDNALQGRGVPNYLGAPVISPDGASAWVPSKQDNINRGTLRDGQNLNFQNTVRAIASRVSLSTFAEDYPSRVDLDNSGLGSAAVFHTSGAYLFVALQTSRHVAVLDPTGHTELFRFDVGRAPDGLAVSADGTRLYVNNFMDRTLGVFDLTPLVTYGQMTVTPLASAAAVGTEKLTAQVLLGKQLFYDARDPRLARDAYLSCAACHNDGGHDGRTWDLTGMGEGLRNTIALRGRAGSQGFLHWSGNFDEVQDFEGQIRNLSQGSGLMTDAQFNTGTRSQPLGDKKAGVSSDLDALAAYVGSLNTFATTPFRNADGSLTAAAVAGKTVFDASCTSCHSGANFTDSGANTLHDVGTLKASSGSRLGGPLTGIDTPTLRDVWATAPYLHDGSAATVSDAIAAHTAITLNATDLANVSAYVQQIGSEQPGTGVRYVRLEALSEINGNPYTSMAEFNLLDGSGSVLPRTGWVAVADSQETVGENGYAANAIDGSNTTIWHTQWQGGAPPPPHTYTVDLGQPQTVGGFKYLPRQDGYTNGNIGTWRFWTSVDGVTWTVVTSGSFGTGSTEKVVTFSAGTPNQPPTLAAVANQSGTVGVAATLTLVGADPNGDPLTYAATGLPAGLTLNASTGVIAGTPTTAGTYAVTATVNDGRGGTATSSFTWTVVAANTPPTLAAVANQSGTVGTALSLTLVGADADGDTLTYAATGLPAGLTLATTTGVISGTPTTAATYNVTATVSDGRGGSASRSFTWTVVSAANQPPTLAAVAAQSGTVGVAATLTLVGADPNNDPLTYSATGLPAGLTLNASTGVIAGTPTTAGSSSVTATVSDGRGGTASRTFTWTVVAANTPPTLAAVANQSGTVGTAASLTLVGADADGDALTYAATGLPAGMTLGAGTGMIAGTPTTPGTFNVTATVSDGRGGSASRSFTWTVVTAVNTAPTLAVVANQSGTVGTATTLTLVGADADKDVLTYAATGLPAGLSLNTATGVISGTPTTAATYNVTATVSDGRGGTASRSFTWTIAAAPAGQVRYVRLTALTEVNGNPWTSMAEFNVLTTGSVAISRTGWTVSVDSQETTGQDGAAANAVDGSKTTMWHTQWSGGSPALPHTFTVDMKQMQTITGFKYLPRQDGSFNGTIAKWAFSTSVDGVTWVQVKTGTFAKTAAEKTVSLP